MKLSYGIAGVVLLVIIIGWFYWFQWRPSKIAKYCNSWASDESGYTKYPNDFHRENYETLYKKCLREQGLK